MWNRDFSHNYAERNVAFKTLSVRASQSILRCLLVCISTTKLLRDQLHLFYGFY